MAPSGGAEKDLNMVAQLQIIPYKKPQKDFLEFHGLIEFLCAQTLALPCAFGTTATSWQFFVVPCNDVGKYFYTSAHLQYMGYKAVVEVFFQVTSGWSKWCAQTLHPFSQIFHFFRPFGFRAPMVAPPSENFENCSIGWKAFSSEKKRCKYHLNRPANADAMSCGSNSATHQIGRRLTALFSKK